MRDYVKTELAPIPRGCYEQAVSFNNTLYLAGQIPLDPVTGQLVGDDFAVQLRQIFQNISSVLQAAGSDFSKVLKLTVYLSNFEQDYPKVDSVMNELFIAPFPARTTIGVAKLPLNSLVEVDAIAAIKD